jgi:citrate lyase subunit beta / citryl-CoA lyase
MPAHRSAQEILTLRSLLFVPGDRPDRFAKAAASGADALILDLEDSVTAANKGTARTAIAAFLAEPRPIPLFVRVNPLDSDMTKADLAAIYGGKPDGLVLPKAEGAASVRRLHDLAPFPVLPIATETATAIFTLGSYAEVTGHLAGLTWGAEDLPAAIGAHGSRDGSGRFTPPYELARSLTLFGAHAAGVRAIDTVYPDFGDLQGLDLYARRAAFDGFSGMMAIHPAQVPVINAAFTPSAGQIAHARAIVDAFAANPDAGALQIDGRMIDAPHLKSAYRLLGIALPTAPHRG